MEPITIAATAALVMKYLLPAIKNLGEKVLEQSENTVSDATVGFGKRLLHLLLHRGGQFDQSRPQATLLERGVERRVLAVVNDPGQMKAPIQLEGAIEDLLSADSDLLASIVELLDGAPTEEVRQGDRSSYIGRDNSGTIITGDGNAVIGR
jgi:hypothetical protein